MVWSASVGVIIIVGKDHAVCPVLKTAISSWHLLLVRSFELLLQSIDVAHMGSCSRLLLLNFCRPAHWSIPLMVWGQDVLVSGGGERLGGDYLRRRGCSCRRGSISWHRGRVLNRGHVLHYHFRLIRANIAYIRINKLKWACDLHMTESISLPTSWFHSRVHGSHLNRFLFSLYDILFIYSLCYNR